MPLQSTSGAASYDAFGGGVAAVPKYIEDYFSTFLYTGNGSTQTITNGIDLSTKGGLVWAKSRAAGSHFLYDTTRGVNKYLMSNATDSQTTQADSLTAFNTTGFSIGNALFNDSAVNYASWSWAKAPKFFDVVTYTGNGATRKVVNHNLGSTPGCIIIKRTDSTSDWAVYHQGLNGGSGPEDYKIFLNTTAAQASGVPYVISTLDSTTFTLGSDGSGGGSTLTNVNGATYVAYLFAHNAGGFGLTGTDNVISCGSFTTDGSGAATINLGYEPQWLLVKRTDSTSQWFLWDTMRGFTANATSSVANLYANLSNAEAIGNGPAINATGFIANGNLGSSASWIYIAIRRGPMKVPTSGTSVFGDISASVEPVSTNLTTESGVLTDLVVHGLRISGSSFGRHWLSRLTGDGAYLVSSSTAAETTQGNFWKFDNNNYAYIPPSGYANNSSSGTKYVAYSFKRAPSFMDVVCYTGAGTGTTPTHNLAAVPELMIFKRRDAVSSWYVWCTYGPLDGSPSFSPILGRLDFSTSFDRSPSLAGYPSSTTFTVGSLAASSGGTYVAYLFATCAGVSKVGSYTGTAATLQIDCGFTGGARFVLIKKTSGTGSWYVWDSARGIVSGNDPYLLLNSTAAEVTNTDYIDTYSAGFEISSTAPSEINENGGSFIFLAIA